MSIVDKAIETQLLATSGLTKHGELRDFAKRELGLGHGDANTLAHICLKSDGASAAAASGGTIDDVIGEIYAGPKAALRPIHDAFMTTIGAFGEFEIAPKKGYVSLRRTPIGRTSGDAAPAHADHA